MEQNLDPLLARKIQLDRLSPRLVRMTCTGSWRTSESFTGSLGRSHRETRPRSFGSYMRDLFRRANG